MKYVLLCFALLGALVVALPEESDAGIFGRQRRLERRAARGGLFGGRFGCAGRMQARGSYGCSGVEEYRAPPAPPVAPAACPPGVVCPVSFTSLAVAEVEETNPGF
jgi:hypothetical protein